jgi:hypothetical protein
MAVLSILALLGCGSAAAAGTAPRGRASTGSTGLLGSPLLWATVDVCKSSGGGGTVGLRGSMPGTGNANEQMYMFFSLQYRKRNGDWTYLSGAHSGLLDVGSSEFRSRQAGIDFQISPSTRSKTVLRGTVRFDWRLGGSVLHTTTVTTSDGHHAQAGASPAGFSAAHCTIS